MEVKRVITERNSRGGIIAYKYLVDGKEVPEGFKYCPACKTVKSKEEFSAHGNACKICANARSRAHYAKRMQDADWAQKKRDKAKVEHKLAKQKAVDMMGGKCTDCGGVFPLAAFEFHHLEPGTKEGNLANILRKKNWKEAEKELSKCVLLCANCHRIRHFEGGYE